MPIYIASSLVQINWECSRCKKSGFEEVEGDLTQGCGVEVYSFTCPECGAELYADSDEWDEDEDEEY